MSTATHEYKRLAGRGRRKQGPISVAAAKCSLWVGADHVLSVDRLWVNEDYKRFYFRDIQSITIEQTKTAMFWSWILGTLAGVTAIFFWLITYNMDSSVEHPAVLAMGGTIAGIFLLALVINFLRGPSCICRLRTAVQTEVLPSLGRTGPARRALAILKPLIEQTQGALAHGAVEVSIAEPIPRVEGAKPRAPQPNTALEVHGKSNGLTHAALFAMLLIDAVAGFYKHSHLTWHFYFLISTISLLAVTALSITALVRPRDTVVPAGLRGLTIVTFIFNLMVLFALFIYGFISRMAYAMQHPGQLPSHIDFYAMPGFNRLSLAADIVELGLGVAGLIVTMVYVYRSGKESVPRAGANESGVTP